MDSSAMLSVGALPLAEMDRIGVSGNQDQNTALSEAFGFEQNLAALLGGALITQPNQVSIDSKSEKLTQSLAKQIELNLGHLKDSKELKMVSGVNSLSVDDSTIENFSIKNSIEGSLNNLAGKSPQSGLVDPMKTLGSLRSENRESLMDMNLEAGGFDRLQSLSSESSLKSNLRDDLGEALQLKASGRNEIKVGKPLNVKNLADSLFIQGQIGSDSIFQKAPMKTENLPTENLATQVQTNLVQDMEAFISQVIETNEGGSISLKLRPGNLGEVQVKVDVQADSVRIQMDAQSQFTESVLKSQSHELKQQLQSLGLKIDELQISSKASSEQFHDSKDQRNSNNPFSQQEQRKDQQNSQRQFFFDENFSLNFEEA